MALVYIVRAVALCSAYCIKVICFPFVLIYRFLRTIKTWLNKQIIKRKTRNRSGRNRCKSKDKNNRIDYFTNAIQNHLYKHKVMKLALCMMVRIYYLLKLVVCKLYWCVRIAFNKVYWLLYKAISWLYWKTRAVKDKLYWSIYKKSREIYSHAKRNTYGELFLFFFRYYLKGTKEKNALLPICDCEKYIKQHEATSSIRIVVECGSGVVCIPQFFEKSEEQLYIFETPDIHVSEITDAEVIAGTNALIADNHLINDVVLNGESKRIDICYLSIKRVVGGVAVVELPQKVVEIEEAINLIGAASFNYYHLVVEILSRLSFVDQYLEYRSYPILVDEIVLKVKQYKSALECINRFNHPIVIAEKGVGYKVNKLISPSACVWMPTNLYDRTKILTRDFLISENVLHNIRSSVGLWTEREPWRKIFISRKNTQAVRLKNELEIRNVFERSGFEIVYTEEMSFREQVECFGQAVCVVGSSGAALTNTIFCQKGSIIGCIIPSQHHFYMYSTIAHILELKPIFLDATITEMTPYAAADTFIVDVDYAKRYANYINGMINRGNKNASD